MASIQRTLSKKVDSAGKAEILLRVSVSRNTKLRIKSGVFVEVSRFRNGELIVPRSGQQAHEDYKQASKRLRDTESIVLEYCNVFRDDATKQGALKAIIEHFHPEKLGCNNRLIDVFDSFLEYQSSKNIKTELYELLKKKLQVFQAYTIKRTKRSEDYLLSEFDTKEIQRFHTFLINESNLLFGDPICQKFYKRSIRSNGVNTISITLQRLCTFFKWCVKMDLLLKNPFDKYQIPRGKYGTPYYLTLEERNQIADLKMSDSKLDSVRDLFIFQCLIGCRISDLLRLKLGNLVNGAIEYVPQKTRNHDSKLVRVPLNERALKIVAKYEHLHAEGNLLPVVSSRDMNYYLKKVFELCGITRPVTILNPKTGIEEQRPINEIASTHLARRTFIGNLYKHVKDPELIGSLSGHTQGSKAFARYRTIDDDIKKEIVDLIK